MNGLSMLKALKFMLFHAHARVFSHPDSGSVEAGSELSDKDRGKLKINCKTNRENKVPGLNVSVVMSQSEWCDVCGLDI